MKKRIISVFLIGIVVLFLFVFINILCSSCFLKSEKLSISSEKVKNSVRIALLTDLHGQTFGKCNEKLVSAVEKQEPDIICITGDIVDKNKDTIEIATGLIEQLTKIAPVYVSLGNHEYEYPDLDVDGIITLYKKAGAEVVDFNYVETQINGSEIRIGGFYGYGCPDKNENTTAKDSLFLKEFQSTENFKLLLSHMPHAWYHAGSLDFWDPDLVLCGHTHGGQIRIPFIGGLYAPDMGWFPGIEKGIYKSEDGTRTMILSTGLGNTENVPRFNNRPEIVTIDITPEE